jgi:hypothetical protein
MFRAMLLVFAFRDPTEDSREVEKPSNSKRLMILAQLLSDLSRARRSFDGCATVASLLYYSKMTRLVRRCWWYEYWNPETLIFVNALDRVPCRPVMTTSADVEKFRASFGWYSDALSQGKSPHDTTL